MGRVCLVCGFDCSCSVGKAACGGLRYYATKGFVFRMEQNHKFFLAFLALTGVDFRQMTYSCFVNTQVIPGGMES